MTLRPERGFTLVEMMIALAIASLCAALAFPYFAPRAPGASLGAAAQEVRVALAAARSAAIAEDRDVTFSGGAGFFRIDGVRHELPPFAPLAVEIKGRSGIAFHPSGASSGGRIVVRSASQRREIEIDPLTGHAALLP